MKVLQVSNYYYPHIGGIEQVARDIVHSLGDRGDVEQKLFCFNHLKENVTQPIDGIDIIRAGTFAKVASQSLSLSYGRILKKTVKTFKPDCIIFHYPNPFAALYLLPILKKNPNIKLVLYWHLDITKQKVLGKLFKGQTLKLLNRATRVVATSPNYIEGSKFLPSFRHKCVVIPNCVTLSNGGVREGATKIREENKGKIIAFALGRHIPYKGMEYLVRASKLLDDNFVIFIGGQGELTPKLKELANGDDKVIFLGKISDDERDDYLQACDIFCFPSITKNEAFGIALAEAMAQGKPAVTFTIEGSGVNYVSLNGVTGIEAENANVQEYASAMQKLAMDEGLRIAYGKAAKERVQNLFSFEKFAENINSLIDNL